MGNFQNIFRQLRISSGLTQRKIASRLGISRSTIGMYETGAREPDFDTLEKIADFFNVDTDYLLGRTDKTTLLPETIGQYSQLNKMKYLLSQLNEDGKQEAVKRVDELTCIPRYRLNTELLSAHQRTDIEVTPEGIQNDLDIMNDDNLWK